MCGASWDLILATGLPCGWWQQWDLLAQGGVVPISSRLHLVKKWLGMAVVP